MTETTGLKTADGPRHASKRKIGANPFRFIAVRALPKKQGGGWHREVFE